MRVPVGVALAAAMLGTALALAQPRPPAAGSPEPAASPRWKPQPPKLTTLAAPGLVDGFTDDEGQLTLLSETPPQEGTATHPSWLLAPGWQAVWEGQAAQAEGGTGIPDGPGVLTVMGPGGGRTQTRLAARPSLLVAAPEYGKGGSAQVRTLPIMAVLPSTLRQDAGTMPAMPALGEAGGGEAQGDRVLLLSGSAQRELFRAPPGAVTALATGPAGSGPSRGGAAAISWVAAGKPLTVSVALLDEAGKEIWRVGLSRPVHRLALVGGGRVIAAAGQDLVALEAGEVRWRRQLPAHPVALEAAPGGLLLVALPDRLLATAENGFTLWEVKTAGRAAGMRLSPEGDRGVLIEPGQVELFSLRRE